MKPFAPAEATQPPMRDRPWLQTFRALRHRDFRLFWFGQIFSLSGTWLQLAARQWLIYRLTGSPLALGAIAFLGLLPAIPVALIGGAIVDRVPKRKLIIVTQAGLMLQALLLAVLTWRGVIQVWHLVLLELVAGMLGAIDLPARQAFVVEMVGKDDLMNAVALNSAIFSAARAVGPAVGGLLIATLGEAGCFLINGVSYLPVLGGLLLMRTGNRPAERGAASLGANMVEGFRYLLHQRVLLGLVSLMAVIGLFGMTHITLMPVFARDVLSGDAERYGFLLAAIGIGAVIGALGVASLKHSHRGRWMLAGSLSLALALVLFALSRQVVWSWIALVGAGAAFIAVQALINTLIQVSVEDASEDG
jgi:MFS family permease